MKRIGVAVCLMVVCWILAVGQRSAEPQFIRAPELRKNPNTSVPLAAILEFASDRPVRATIHLQDGVSSRLLYQSEGYSPAHSIPVLGLRPNRTELISLTITDAGGATQRSRPLEFKTDPLPPGLPSIETTVSQASKMEPGLTLFNLGSGNNPALGLLVAVNESGEVVWFYKSDKSIGDARRTRNGTILFADTAGAVEIDILGNVLRRWHPRRAAAKPEPGSTAVATDMMHHEVYAMLSGDYLTLSTEVRDFDNYLSSETDPNAPRAKANVAGDVVVQFRPDGTVVTQWSLLDLLDPYRIGFGSLGGQWNFLYPETAGGTKDWSHANAVIHDPSDDSVIVSLRNQDVVVKIDRKSGKLLWILGDPSGWDAPWQRYLLAPEGDLIWPYHQHAPMITPKGTLLLFDNGNFRHRPFDRLPDQDYSRIVEYAINPGTMKVSEVWSWGWPRDERFFSGALGDANWLPVTGNVLATDGFRAAEGTGGSRWARIVEVTHTTPPEKVFELVVKDSSGQQPAGWTVYRSERIPSLYPPASATLSLR